MAVAEIRMCKHRRSSPLRNGNELSLDFGIIEAQGAQVVAVASLIGGVDMTDPTIRVVDPVKGTESELPFIEVFHESELH